MMGERRKSSRMILKSKTVVKRLDVPTQGEEVAIEVTDVSKDGIGFQCTEILTISAVYEAFLTIWTKEVLHAFLEIVRIEKKGEGLFEYGAIFVGMPEMDSARIETYQTIEAMKD